MERIPSKYLVDDNGRGEPARLPSPATDALTDYTSAARAYIQTRDQLTAAEAQVERLKSELATVQAKMAKARERLDEVLGVPAATVAAPEPATGKRKRPMTEARLAAIRANQAKAVAAKAAKREQISEHSTESSEHSAESSEHLAPPEGDGTV